VDSVPEVSSYAEHGQIFPQEIQRPIISIVFIAYKIFQAAYVGLISFLSSVIQNESYQLSRHI
jgi:hypothetical protein